MKLLVIDEISNVDPTTFFILNIRLQQVMKNQLPFGGINVLVVGDFMQLPPTRRVPFPTALMYQADARHPDPQGPQSNNLSQLENPFDMIGCDLFSQFTRFHLTQQHRAECDIEHYEFCQNVIYWYTN